MPRQCFIWGCALVVVEARVGAIILVGVVVQVATGVGVHLVLRRIIITDQLLLAADSLTDGADRSGIALLIDCMQDSKMKPHYARPTTMCV
jgi:hypothetical protein